MPIRAVDCYVCPCNDKLLLLPGHMDLPEYETSLNLAIQNNYSMTTLHNLPGALFELTRLCAEKYNVDYVFFDVSAGLGVINQVAFISSDAFIVPTNPDPFSIMALQTLSKALPRWKRWADLTRPSLADASYPLPDAGMQFLGEVCLKYSKRKSPPTNSYSKAIEDIKEFVSCSFVQTLNKYDMVYKRSEYRMAEIPDFAPLLPAAMEADVPVSALSEEDDSVRAADLRAIRNELHDIFSSIADTIVGTVK